MQSTRRTRPPHLPTDREILGRAGRENFTVASRVLRPEVRRHLLAFYGYARLIDQLGDDYDGDRTAALHWARAELDVALADPADPTTHPLIAGAAGAVVDLGADATPLRDLIAANLVDQTVSSYDTWDDLIGYCRLSADPVGRLVLAAFAATTPERVAHSDDVCRALQVIEHLQDVAEDALAGRVYLPEVDLRSFGVDPAELVGLARAADPAPAPVRALVAFEAWRARVLLDRGGALVASLHGRARLATAGFVAGGYGALDAIADNHFDPFTGSSRPAAPRVAAHAARLLRSGSTTVSR